MARTSRFRLVAFGIASAAVLVAYPLLSLASVASSASMPGAPPSVVKSLRAELKSRKTKQFAELFKTWETRYGTQAVRPLVEIASDRTLSDADRYVALMGSARLGGAEAGPWLTPFLKDHSWMLRSGALRTISALHHTQAGPAVLPLLKDPALVVRLEAVQAVEKLHPAGAASALVAAINDPANYHGGKAQWVPERALEALAVLGAKDQSPRLRPLLDRSGDDSLLRQAVITLEALHGTPESAAQARTAALSPLVQKWKTKLSQK